MPYTYVIGVGMIRFNKYPRETLRSMTEKAIDLALIDAGLEKKDLNAAFFSNTCWGMFEQQHSIRGQVILRGMGIDRIPVINVENAGAGGSTALHMAIMGIQSGMYDVVLAVAGEKIYDQDKAGSLSAYACGLDRENIDKNRARLREVARSFDSPLPEKELKPGEGFNLCLEAYAVGARRHMSRYGSTARQLAAIASKNHYHASLNPMAQYQVPMTPEQVLADKPLIYPFTRTMCAPIADGAAAAIVCSEPYLRLVEGIRPIRILASVLGQGTDRDRDDLAIGDLLSQEAYDLAGLGPEDVDVAELHDATAYGELHQTETMGFCPEGEGGIYAESGASTLGGVKPINTSGGLECLGYPLGASGLAQIHEIVMQLREEAGPRQVEGARIGLTQNCGGNIGWEEAVMGIHILERIG